MKLSEKDRLVATGLLYLAKKASKHTDELVEALAEVLGEKADPAESNYFGHVSDAVFSDYTLAELLRKLDASRKAKARR